MTEPARPSDQQLADDPSESVVTRFGKAILREEVLSRRVDELTKQRDEYREDADRRLVRARAAERTVEELEDEVFRLKGYLTETLYHEEQQAKLAREANTLKGRAEYLQAEINRMRRAMQSAGTWDQFCKDYAASVSARPKGNTPDE